MCNFHGHENYELVIVLSLNDRNKRKIMAYLKGSLSLLVIYHKDIQHLNTE